MSAAADSAAGRPGRLPGPWTYRRLWGRDLAVLLVLMAATAAVFQLTDLDLLITRCFFFAGRHKPFFLHLSFPWRFLYVYVAVPLALTGLGALAVLMLSYRRETWRRYRIYGLFVLFSLSLGPGLLVNGVLKEYWGRPRPRLVTEFGGRYPYRDALCPGGASRGKSFPCGHSSAGYFFTVFYFVFRRHRRRLGRLLLGFAILLGTVLGYGRVMSGSHFASDVLWSGYLVTLVSWALYYFLLNVPGREDVGLQAMAPAASPAVAWRWGLVAVGIVVASLFATPYYADLLYALKLPPPPAAPAEVAAHFDRGDIDLVFEGAGDVHLEGTADGFGLVGSKLKRRAAVETNAAAPRVLFDLNRRGWFTELNVQTTVYVPTTGVARVAISIDRGNLNVRASEGPLPALDLQVGRGAITLPASWSPGREGVRAEAPKVYYSDTPR